MSDDRRLPRLLRIVAALYPRTFRQQYGEGFLSLLEVERVTPLVLLDLMMGAVDAHLQSIRGAGSLQALVLRCLSRTLINGVYGLVAFPLAVAYFVFLVTGASLGGGLLITLAGIPVLALTVLGVRYAARFERWLTSMALDVDLPAPPTRPHAPMIELQNGRLSLVLTELRRFFLGAETLKAVFYVLIKFPFSIASFASILFRGATGSLLLSAPLAYRFVDYELNALGTNWSVHSLADAILPGVVGSILLLTTVVVINVFAWIWAEVARLLLTSRSRVVDEIVAAQG